jgi:hypothetical protein
MKVSISIPASCAAALVATQVFAQPLFAEFPAGERYPGKPASPKLISKQDKEFQTQLAIAARSKPNFAGSYILTNIGCGANCVLSSIIDARNGNVVWLPFSVCCWKHQEPMEYRLDSTLLVLHGLRDEKEPMGTFYYTFENGQFRLIDQRPE